MEEFALAAGLSRPTVSKYFKDPDSVRPATRERIEHAMGRLGYQPNLLAVNVNRKTPKMIGIIVPSLLDPFYAALVEQVELSALDEGYWTIVLNSHGRRSMEQRAVRNLMSMRVAGSIVVPLGTTSEISTLKELAGTFPLVLADTRIDVEAPFVGTDNFQSISLIVDYLLRTGEPPCYFDMPRVNRNAIERREAYIRAMERRNARPEVISAPAHSWEFEAVAFEHTAKLLSRGPLPTNTILCATDRTAFGVMAAASEHGLAVGREGQLRVAGHDDHPFSRFASPSLTTVAQDGHKMATLALKMLIGRIVEEANEGENAHLLEAQLRMRNSA
ncbi:LacI family DNA-binding transcriptional regulator [Labrys okinawensis]|uniref:LacI family DNA-binding transcriptional regulator n=1 Tax=Labrys okinawensis TaxID=346911 RepID=UPI0039BD4F22